MNWDKLKFQYEVLGDSAQEIAEKHDKSLALVQSVIKSESWKRGALSTAVQNWGVCENPSEIMVEIAEKADLLNALRAAELGPEYFRVESALLNKIHETLRGELQPVEIKQLSDCLVSLRPKIKDAGDSGGAGITINVLAGYGSQSHEEPATVVCDITPAATMKELN